MELLKYLENNTLLMDGAMGTYLTQAYHIPPSECELAALDRPQMVLSVHQAYLSAGCRGISTDTFGANRLNFPEEICKKIIAAGWRIAREAAGDKAFVFADIGPVQGHTPEETAAEYQFIAAEFLSLGAKHFLFETNSSLEGLLKTAAYIKTRDPGAVVALSFASLPDGFTRSGQLVRHLITQAADCPDVDVVGLNCVSGARHLSLLMQRLGPVKKPLLAMPNAGYPTVLGSRTFYQGDPNYFAGQLRQLEALGVSILGGCCGTTPEHISAAARELGNPARTISLSKQEPDLKPKPVENPFWEALCDPNQKPMAVELDPPEGADTEKFMAGAKQLRDGGAAIITIADCPIARARMDSSLLACKVRRELQMEALPHMTCRDRNLNATKALLLGLSAEGVHNVLAVTGDPIPSASREEVKSVYNFNSRMLARYITGLGETVPPFRVYGALNLNAKNFSVQLRLAQEKQENGVSGFLTQPVLTEQALRNLELARKTLSGRLLGGIIPIVSQRNALFMNSEVSGITVDERIIAMYQGLDRQQGEELAVQISAAVAKEIAPWVDGYYLITPFGRTGLMVRIMDSIRQGE